MADNTFCIRFIGPRPITVCIMTKGYYKTKNTPHLSCWIAANFPPICCVLSKGHFPKSSRHGDHGVNVITPLCVESLFSRSTLRQKQNKNRELGGSEETQVPVPAFGLANCRTEFNHWFFQECFPTIYKMNEVWEEEIVKCSELLRMKVPYIHR